MFSEMIKSPNGVLLVTGPTGSGKSTTLYATLVELSRPDVNVSTVEDPVEKKVDGVNQCQILEKAGMTFAAALRSLLRQDPDIIMVGEIRDGETADIAIRAAITGHLVLSTLHTNDAASTILRLIDMGVQPYMVASALIGVVAQRLVRMLCQECKEELYLEDPAELRLLGVDDMKPEREKLDQKRSELIEQKREEIVKELCLDDEISELDNLMTKFVVENVNNEDRIRGVYIYKPRKGGCKNCNGTGYRGRTAIHEVLVANYDIKQVVVGGGTTAEIKEQALKSGTKLLRDNVAKMVIEGRTTMEELVKATYSL
jgi:type IV pilus assembly protein PilB